MSTTRKTLIVTFIVIGSILIFSSFFTELQHRSNLLCCGAALLGIIFATLALVLTIRGYKAKQTV